MIRNMKQEPVLCNLGDRLKTYRTYISIWDVVDDKDAQPRASKPWPHGSACNTTYNGVMWLLELRNFRAEASQVFETGTELSETEMSEMERGGLPGWQE